jgi:transcriptional regulator with PAS, ATPase and Fis domain
VKVEQARSLLPKRLARNRHGSHIVVNSANSSMAFCSELRRGAFTGQFSGNGKFEQAIRLIFLDEIGELDLSLQAHFTLFGKTFDRVGGRINQD